MLTTLLPFIVSADCHLLFNSGFSLTMGSDLWFLLDWMARERRQRATDSLTQVFNVNGTFYPDVNVTSLYDSFRQKLGTDLEGSWTFINMTSHVSREYHYMRGGCYRDPQWPWWRQSWPFWSLVFLVPLYSTFHSCWDLQPWNSRELPVMVSISCMSYGTRKGLQRVLGMRNEVVGAMGAFVIGFVENISHSRKSCF